MERLVRTQRETDQARGTHQLGTTEGLVKTRRKKKTEHVSGTHFLKTAEGETCQDTK